MVRPIAAGGGGGSAGAGAGGGGGTPWYEGVNEVVNQRMTEFRAWFKQEQVSFNTAVGDHVDIVTDVMGSGACGDPVNDAAPESLESIALPKHHYLAIMKLYKTNPIAYAALLKQANDYIDLLKSLQDDGKNSAPMPLAKSISRSRAFLARTLAPYV